MWLGKNLCYRSVYSTLRSSVVWSIEGKRIRVRRSCLLISFFFLAEAYSNLKFEEVEETFASQCRLLYQSHVRPVKKEKKDQFRVRSQSMERRRKSARSMHSNESRFVSTSGLTEHWSICEFRDDPSPTRYRFRGLHFSLRSPQPSRTLFRVAIGYSRVFLVEATTEELARERKGKRRLSRISSSCTKTKKKSGPLSRGRCTCIYECFSHSPFSYPGVVQGRAERFVESN